MAFKNIDKSDILKIVKNRSHKSTLKSILDSGGSDAIWRHDPDTNWDGKTWPLMGKKGPKQIVIKTSGTVINRLIASRRRSANTLSFQNGENIIVKVGGVQPIKFEKTGKLVDSSGKSVPESTMTAMQELGSAWVFKRAIQDNKNFTKWQDIVEDNETYSELQKIWNTIGNVSGPDDEWVENFFKQNKILIQKVGRPNFTEFNRGSSHAKKNYTLPGQRSGNDTFMEFISDLVRVEFGISKKDNWNPADIWLIQNEDKWREKIKKEVVVPNRTEAGTLAQLYQLNAIFRALYRTRQVFGVSLKKVSGTEAKWQEVNVDGKFFKNLETLRYSYDQAKCPLGLKSIKGGGATIETQDSRVYIKDGNSVYNFQIKANSTTSFSGLKYEATQEGYGAARLGKATVGKVIGLMRSYNLTFDSSNSNYPASVNEFENSWKEYSEKITRLMRAGVNLGTVTEVGTAMDNLLYCFNEEPHVANSKLQQITWLDLFLSLGSEQRDQFGTDLVFLSKKEGRDYGPFAKIY